MTAPPLPHDSAVRLARQAREQFVKRAEAALAPMVQAIRSRLSELVETSPGTREMHERRDALMEFERKGAVWSQRASKAWRQALVPPTATARIRLEAVNLTLIGDEVVEMKILSSRLALAIVEKASWDLNDLRVRMQYLEGGEDLVPTDILRPEALAQLLIENWIGAELSREAWTLVPDVIQRHVLEHVPEAYRLANEFLISQEVLRDIDLTARVKRGASSPPGTGRKGDAVGATGQQNPADGGGSGAGGGQGGGNGGRQSGYADSRQGAGQNPDSGGGGRGGRPGGVSDETRLMTSSPPLARARMRATGVLGQLKRLLTERIAGFDSGNPPTRPSPALAEALSQQATHAHSTSMHYGATVQDDVVYDDAAVQEVAFDLRRRTGELKKKASTSNEKATIEIVALMFQSILAEERIPPAVRVWFARLQMPVLRLAIAEPEFFGSLEHPARQLIDRMGSCVMGFNAATIGDNALETEIKRVVQVIEQYPETGRRVFQLVYDEFQKFLSKYLTEKAPTQRLVSVAQQVEQKETLAIQYTIEMRSMLADMPVRDEIREFLFKIWAEVLAISAIKNGPQHADTLALKASASDLVWAASAKPNRNERSRVIQDLPWLLQRLRQGMTLVSIEGKAQESQIKAIGDTLADAFLSKTEAIPQLQIEAMAKRLAHLEDFVADDPATDLPLDAQSIELMLGIDASEIEVVADGGSRPSAGMLAWATELQLGNWFTLDHNGASTQVQYAWRSERKQLHLFAAPGGRSYLIQARRLAAYLQAGLLLPAEEEALTVRATRDALAKLDANPERLLQ
ncbi:MAG: DUF1631 domain-containing protein [Ramlibacter sp.]